jgi:hypothetical protein
VPAEEGSEDGPALDPVAAEIIGGVVEPRANAGKRHPARRAERHRATGACESYRLPCARYPN